MAKKPDHKATKAATKTKPTKPATPATGPEAKSAKDQSTIPASMSTPIASEVDPVLEELTSDAPAAGESTDAPPPAAADQPAPGPIPGNLDELGAEALTKIAADRGIDVGHAKTRRSLIAAIRGGVKKPTVPGKDTKRATKPSREISAEARAAVAKIDEELSKLGDPQAKVAQLGEALAQARAEQKRTASEMEKTVGNLLSEHRQAQRLAGRDSDRVADLRKQRARLLGE